jgi:hypothetical protein
MKHDVDIRICFSTADGWTSKLIRWWTKSKISHTFATYQCMHLGMRIALTAEAHGFVAVPMTRYLKSNRVLHEVRPVGKALDDSLRWLVANFLDAGYDYGTVGVAGIKLRLKLLWRICGVWLRKKFSSSKRVMCSEAMIRMLQHAEYPSVAQFDPETTDAQTFLEAVQRASNEFEMAT